MSARNPLHNDPHESTHGEGNYGVRFTRFVPSGGPGGYSTVETVNLFPTRDERDAYARHLRQKERPRYRTGPLIETFEVDVAALSWFERAYVRAVLLGDTPELPYALVRIYDTDPPRYDVEYASTEEELRYRLAEQWHGTDPEPLPGEPREMYDVVYLAPDEPLRLRIVIEDDETEDSK